MLGTCILHLVNNALSLKSNLVVNTVPLYLYLDDERVEAKKLHSSTSACSNLIYYWDSLPFQLPW